MDLRDFYSREFNVDFVRGVAGINGNSKITILTNTTTQINISYTPASHPNPPDQVEREYAMVWNNTTEVRLDLDRGIITGKLGGGYSGRKFCISLMTDLETQGRKLIHCFIEKWHQGVDGRPAQDDGEWHGSGN